MPVKSQKEASMLVVIRGIVVKDSVMKGIRKDNQG